MELNYFNRGLINSDWMCSTWKMSNKKLTNNKSDCVANMSFCRPRVLALSLDMIMWRLHSLVSSYYQRNVQHVYIRRFITKFTAITWASTHCAQWRRGNLAPLRLKLRRDETRLQDLWTFCALSKCTVFSFEFDQDLNYRQPSENHRPCNIKVIPSPPEE